MKLTAQETQLVYEALRVLNAALGARKVELIREYRAACSAGTTTSPDMDTLNKTFDVQDAITNLLQKLERAVEKPVKKRKPKDGKNERRA
jgi:ribosome-associated translation inhibitor RaiA